MKKTYIFKETVNHFHQVEMDDEIDVEAMTMWLELNAYRYETGYEAIAAYLSDKKSTYGFDFDVKPNYCGTEILDLQVEEEVY